jgi:hypothetical protein
MPHNLRGRIFADDMYCSECGHHDRTGARHCSGEHEPQLKHPRTKRMTYLDATRKRLAELEKMEREGTLTIETAQNLVHERWQLEYLLRPENSTYKVLELERV